jgi:hypothetical protein
MTLLTSLQFKLHFVAHQIRKVLGNLVYLCFENIMGKRVYKKYQEIILG